MPEAHELHSITVSLQLCRYIDIATVYFAYPLCTSKNLR